MKNIFLAIGFLLVLGFASQKRNLSATEIELNNMNLIYKGIKNPISIKNSKYKNEDLIISIEGGTLIIDTLETGLQFYILPDFNIRDLTVTISLEEKEKLHILAKKKFRVRPIPNPIVQLGGLPNDGLPKAKALVLVNSGLISSVGSHFPYNLQSRVLGFEAEIITKSDRTSFISNTARLPIELKEKTGSMKSGDLLIFKSIKTRITYMNDTLYTKTPPIVITIR